MPLPNVFNIGRQVKGWFYETAGAIVPTWKQYATEGSSDGPSEQLWWMGSLPQPYEFAGEYGFQGLLDFTYSIENLEYVLSFLIDLKSIEDNPDGAIPKRITQAATFWEMFKNQQFATLLEAGGTLTGYDGLTFFNTAHLKGLATLDNAKTDSGWTSATVVTTAQFLTSFELMKATLLNYGDDQGRGGMFNALASKNLRLLVPAQLERAAREVLNAEIIVNTTNAFANGAADLDVLPILSSTSGAIYLAAVGDPTSRPIIFQTRTQPEITVFDDRLSVVDNHGLKVIVRQRYRMQYGEYGRIVRLVGS